MSEAITDRAMSAELELVGKGFTEDQARAAVRQAVRWSTRMASRLSPAIRDQAALDLLEDRLRNVEHDYLVGFIAAAQKPDDARFAEGLESAGFTAGPETRKRYREGMERIAGS